MSSIGFIARFSSFDLLNKPDSADDRYSIFQPLLETLVHDNHRLYEMENRDKTNVLYRTLAALYELGGEFGYKSISIARKGVGYQLSDGEMLQTNKYQDYLIKCLLSLSATQEQSIKAYYNILPDLVPLRSTISMEITKDNWREHLGNSRLGTSSCILFSTLALLIVEYMQFLCSVSCILCSSDS